MLRWRVDWVCRRGLRCKKSEVCGLVSLSGGAGVVIAIDDTLVAMTESLVVGRKCSAA